MGMSRSKSFLTVVAFGLAVAAFGTPQVASAARGDVDHGKAEALASKIEAALAAAGCGAALQDNVNTIQGEIGASGAQPKEAEAALHMVLRSPGLCPTAATAVVSVDQTVAEAAQNDYVPAAGGPGGGAPIGAPASYVSAGGSDYLVK